MHWCVCHCVCLPEPAGTPCDVHRLSPGGLPLSPQAQGCGEPRPSVVGDTPAVLLASTSQNLGPSFGSLGVALTQIVPLLRGAPVVDRGRVQSPPPQKQQWWLCQPPTLPPSRETLCLPRSRTLSGEMPCVQGPQQAGDTRTGRRACTRGARAAHAPAPPPSGICAKWHLCRAFSPAWPPGRRSVCSGREPMNPRAAPHGRCTFPPLPRVLA